MAEEQTFYSDQSGVRVTDKRVILGNTTYALANITSVTSAVEPPDRMWPVIMIVVAVILLITGISGKSGAAAFWGAVIGAAGVLWYRSRKPVWHLRIASASGEATPLQSENGGWIDGICKAINEAIIHRA